jgi:hypothetical protein
MVWQHIVLMHFVRMHDMLPAIVRFATLFITFDRRCLCTSRVYGQTFRLLSRAKET